MRSSGGSCQGTCEGSVDHGVRRGQGDSVIFLPPQAFETPEIPRVSISYQATQQTVGLPFLVSTSVYQGSAVF